MLDQLLGAAPGGLATPSTFKPDYNAVRKAVEDLLDSNEGALV